MRDLGSWFHSAGAGGSPPEALQLVRDYVKKQCDLAVQRERERKVGA